MQIIFRYVALIALLSRIIRIQTLQVTFDRSWVSEYNEKYLRYANSSVTRFGRKSPYYLNFQFDVIYPIVNNITMHMVFYEYLHNEYRRSFVEMHGSLCSESIFGHYVGKMFMRAGLKCPVPPGPTHLTNMTIDMAYFPYKVPFTKCQVEICFTSDETQEVMGRGYVQITVKEPLRKEKN